MARCGLRRARTKPAHLLHPLTTSSVGTETTQSGGKTGRVVKTAAIAAPYESGKVLTIMMRTKVDILTVSFHDADGGLHGAIFALPIGQASVMRTQLTQAGAHATPEESAVSEGSKP